MSDISTPKIRQCKTGHSFCQVCVVKHSKCSVCHQDFTNTINYALMQIRSETLRACRNKVIYCNFKGFPIQVLQHEAFCHPYECPFKLSDNCPVVGDKKGLIQHCLKQHPQLIINDQSDNSDSCVVIYKRYTDIATTKNTIYVYGNIFRIVKKSTAENTFWMVKIYDSKVAAKNYSFSIELQKGGRKMSFSDFCKSVADDTVIIENCLQIPCELLEGFVDNFSVWKIAITRERTS